MVEWAVLDILTRLVDKSLLIAETGEKEARYRQLETVREYARDRLVESGEVTDTARRHRDWFLALVARAEPEFFRGVESAEWLDAPRPRARQPSRRPSVEPRRARRGA